MNLRKELSPSCLWLAIAEMNLRAAWRRFSKRPSRSAFPSAWVVTLSLSCAVVASAGPDQSRGLPFIRTYPLDEIGSVPRSLRLGFDGFGRIAIMYDGIYSVLNDSAWVDRIDKSAPSKVRMTTIKVAGGNYYYGGRGSWGTVELNPGGTFRAAPLVPPDAPAWTSITPFNKLLATSNGIYFYELGGVVRWDFALRRNAFFEMPRLVTAFAVGDRVFTSCEDLLIRELVPASGATHVVRKPDLDGQIVEHAAAMDEKHTLLALRSGRLVAFDGENATPWRPQTDYQINGRITGMERLVDGGVAIALADQGVFIFSSTGSLEWSLTVPEFHRIGSMAAGEPGVLWVAGENAVHRIYYDTPLTSFGQPLGLTAIWPHVERWNSAIVACSNKSIYEMPAPLPGHLPAFRILRDEATRPADFIAASGAHLLTGNSEGVSIVSPDGTITPLVRIENVAALEFIQPDTCIAIGSREIAALKFVDGQWIEYAPRIEGVGDAPIRVEKQNQDSLWIEMGGDRVALLLFREGKLALRKIALPWRGEQWTNVGILGNTVIFSATSGQRTYYDAVRETLCEEPRLDQLLKRSPFWISRVKQDATGVIWATHPQGVVTFTPQGDDYAVDASTFELRNDSYPSVTILPDNDVWISTGRSLYHVERRTVGRIKNPHTVLVSLGADQHHLELVNQTGQPATPPQFSFDDNSLSFRFFSGTYAWRFPPLYEYRLGPAEPWTPVDPSLVLRFPKLRDGAYRLEMRQARPHDTNSPPFDFSFVITPPWYRTPTSYVAYAAILLGSILGIARWINLRSLQRNVVLETLVHDRTRELEITMEKLGEETRNAATLAERSRLAGEIHDSLQQGLSGTILHLETTLTHPSIAPEVRSQLNIIRSMLSYSREEVQQAVWNLESPLLQNSTLGDALQKLAGYINTGSIKIKVVTHAEPAPLEAAIQHNLLRITQEAITNAVKHSAASLIEVTLESHADCVVLSVTDNGQGFDPVARSQVEGHFGLRGLRARARSIKARLEIKSSPGAGTVVQVAVPAKENQSHDSDGQNKSA